MRTYAGIGSRTLDEDERNLCYDIGRWLARQGWELRTGAAPGADKAFAEGALSVNGAVTLCLPWPNYEGGWVSALTCYTTLTKIVLNHTHKEAWDSVNEYHPNVAALTNAARSLHARNWLIVEPARFVIAWPKGATGGGTGQGIRIARGLNKTLFNLENEEDMKRILTKIR